MVYFPYSDELSLSSASSSISDALSNSIRGIKGGLSQLLPKVKDKSSSSTSYRPDHIMVCFIGHPDINMINYVLAMSGHESWDDLECAEWYARVWTPLGTINVDYCILSDLTNKDVCLRQSDVFIFAFNEKMPETLEFNRECYKRISRMREDDDSQISLVLGHGDLDEFNFGRIADFSFKSPMDSLWALSDRSLRAVILECSCFADFDEDLVTLLLCFVDEGSKCKDSFPNKGVQEAFLSPIQLYFDRIDEVDHRDHHLCYKLC